jgi:Zn-dependent M28 family amino/carboxypeptidase
VLAVARFLREIDCRTVPIILAFFDEEEKGDLGSTAFATMLLGTSRGVKVAYTADMIGWDNDGDRAIEIELPGTGIFAALNASKTAGGFTMPLEQTTSGGTDHVAFRDQGISAVGFCEEWANGDTTPYYHTAKDTIDTVNLPYLASTTAFVNYHFARVARGL